MDLKKALQDYWSAKTLKIEQEAEGRIKETISTMERKQADRIYLQAFAEYFSKKNKLFQCNSPVL
jgi:hypothetical protein